MTPVRHEALLFGFKRNGIPINIPAAPNLGWGVTQTPETAPAKNSMFGKHYERAVSSPSTGCEQTILRLKLNRLNSASKRKQKAQFLCAVSNQPAVGYKTRSTPCSGSVGCLGHDGGISKPTMSRINGTNGKPKGFMPNACLTSHRLRRIKRTLGSTITRTKKPLRRCLADAMADGGFVVPRGGQSPPSERNPGKPGKIRCNASVTEASSSSDSNTKAQQIVERWRSQEKNYKGVKVPLKLAKVIRVGKKNTESVFDDLYPLLLTREMFDLAYSKIKSNPGMMTPGNSEETLSGWGPDVISNIISKLSDESFQFSRSRMVKIPKASGGKRGLKIATPRDKVVQKIIADILEAIYEPSFSEHSFGFRSQLGCHDALESIQKRYRSTRWFIEGDIAKCFDEIDHHILISIIRRRIKDERFIRLLYKALRAGYLDTFKIPRNCLIGSPQGSIVSPILCNIILNEFDQYVDKVLTPEYTRGVRRRQPLQYKRLLSRSDYSAKKYKISKNPKDLIKSKELRKLAQSMPSVEPKDPGFRRLCYTRYADDWLIGFAGPVSEAEEIREKCRAFLASLNMRLSLEKTLITKGTKGCVYLGTVIHVPLNEQRFLNNARYKERASLGVRLNAPLDRVIGKLSSAGYCKRNGFPTPRMSLYAADKDELVDSYSATLRGILNYYSFADNYPRLGASVSNILRNSAAKVLAAKFKLHTVRQVLLKFGHHLEKGSNKGLPNYKDPVVRGEFFKNGRNTSRISLFRTARLTINSNGLACAVCGSTFGVAMHHVRLLKDLNKKMDPISYAMAARKRKQIPLCRVHHTSQHVNLNKVRRGAEKHKDSDDEL